MNDKERVVEIMTEAARETYDALGIEWAGNYCTIHNVPECAVGDRGTPHLFVPLYRHKGTE